MPTSLTDRLLANDDPQYRIRQQKALALFVTVGVQAAVVFAIPAARAFSQLNAFAVANAAIFITMTTSLLIYQGSSLLNQCREATSLKRFAKKTLLPTLAYLGGWAAMLGTAITHSNFNLYMAGEAILIATLINGVLNKYIDLNTNNRMKLFLAGVAVFTTTMIASGYLFQPFFQQIGSIIPVPPIAPSSWPSTTAIPDTTSIPSTTSRPTPTSTPAYVQQSGGVSTIDTGQSSLTEVTQKINTGTWTASGVAHGTVSATGLEGVGCNGQYFAATADTATTPDAVNCFNDNALYVKLAPHGATSIAVKFIAQIVDQTASFTSTLNFLPFLSQHTRINRRLLSQTLTNTETKAPFMAQLATVLPVLSVEANGFLLGSLTAVTLTNVVYNLIPRHWHRQHLRLSKVLNKLLPCLQVSLSFASIGILPAPYVMLASTLSISSILLSSNKARLFIEYATHRHQHEPVIRISVC